MPKMLGPNIRFMAIKAVAIKTMVIAMVGFIGRPMVGPMLWMPVSRRGIQLIFLRGVNQVHMVIMSIWQISYSQKTDYKNCSLHSIA